MLQDVDHLRAQDQHHGHVVSVQRRSAAGRRPDQREREQDVVTGPDVHVFLGIQVLLVLVPMGAPSAAQEGVNRSAR